MDAENFDRWTRGISTAAAARRALLGGALAILLAPVLPRDASAGKGGKGGKGKKKKKDKKKPEPCRNGKTRCGDDCVDTSSDRFNCGSCGNDCPEIAECISGLCIACPRFQTRCGDLCVDTTSDMVNCGGCGIACPDGETCINSLCVCSGPRCPIPGGGTHCCPNPGGTCCSNGRCCGQNEICTPDERCCPVDNHSCGDGSCCPNNTNCCGDGITCCPGACLGGGRCA